MDIKPTILVLDDDPMALELYARELAADYQVIRCESVPDTRQYIQNSDLDVLIVEPAVNEGEGWTLLQEIRTIRNPPWVIVCSVDDDRKAGMGHGADVFLVKPVLPSTLHTIIDQMIAKRPLQST